MNDMYRWPRRWVLILTLLTALAVVILIALLRP
jgi:hypothetical protein